LIELMVVMSIVALMSSLIMTALQSARDKGRIGAGITFADNLYQNFGVMAQAVINFDDGPANTSKDLSPNHNDLANGPADTVTTPGTWTTGFNGGGMSYNNNGQYSLIFSPLDTGTWTWAVWIKPTVIDTTGEEVFLSEGNGVTSSFELNHGYPLVTLMSGTMPSSIYNAIIPSGPLPPLTSGKWYFLAVTHVNHRSDAGGTTVIYQDGREIARDTVDNTVAGTGHIPFIVGNYQSVTWGGATFYQCKCTLDEIRIYSESLSSAQIERIYADAVADHAFAHETDGRVAGSAYGALDWGIVNDHLVSLFHSLYENLTSVWFK